MWLLTLGCSLASCGPRIIERAVPAKVTPCHVGPVPVLPDVTFVRCTLDAEGNIEAACTSPPELAALAAWVASLSDWTHAVKACSYVEFIDVSDLIKGDPYLKP